jgi:hypothetical protein
MSHNMHIYIYMSVLHVAEGYYPVMKYYDIYILSVLHVVEGYYPVMKYYNNTQLNYNR